MTSRMHMRRMSRADRRAWTNGATSYRNRYVPDRLGHTAVLTELGVTILASHDTPLSHALAA